MKFSLESAMLEELLNSFHNFILKQKAEAANPFRDGCSDFFSGRFATAPFSIILAISSNWSENGPGLRYALMAPFVRPLTMYFCMKMKIRMTGKMAMIPNAMVEFHRVWYCWT